MTPERREDGWEELGRYVPAIGGFGERAAHYTLEAFRLARSDLYPDHSICGYSCECKARPKGWPKVPPTHPRSEDCHP